MATTVRASSINSSAGSTAVSVARPAGTVTGDVVIVVVNWNDGASETIADNNGATPFTEDLAEFRNNGTLGHAASVFSRRIQAGDPATYNFTLSASQRWTAVAVTWQSPHASSIYDVAPSPGNCVAGGTGNPVSVPAITTVNANAIHCSVLCTDGISNTTTATPSGYTIEQNGGEKLVAFGTKSIASPGTTGTTTYSDSAGVTKTGISFAIRDDGTSVGLAITINGVDRTTKVQSALLEGGRRLTYNRVAGSPATLTLYTYDLVGGAGGYRPAIDQTVVVTDGAQTVFSGVITDIRESALSDAGGGWDKGILCAVTCADQNGLLLRDTYTKTYADGTTLKQVLQDLIANPLSGRSITLDGGQANGSALTGFEFVDAYIDDILNSLTTITGWIWDITPGKVLSMISPGSESCGFSLTDGGGSIYGGVTLEQGRSENYANRVTVVAGPDAQINKTETITGTGAIDHWVLTYSPMVDANGFILSRGLVNENGIELPISPVGGTGYYTWNPATNTLTRVLGALPLGQVSTFIYAVQFPITVTVNDSGEQAAHGIYVRRYIAEDVTDKPVATQLANGLLSRSIASPLILQVAHRKGLAKQGRSVVVTFSERNVNATYMIIEVSFWNDVDGRLTYLLKVVSGTSAPDSWLEFFKRGGTGSGASSSAAPISGAIVPALSGIFQGDLVANSGLDDPGDGFETSLGSYVNSGGAGAALVLGRKDLAYAWAIFADTLFGSSPGAQGSLKFHPYRRESNIECAMQLAEPNTGGTDDFILLPGANANLWIGDQGALMTGLSPGDSRIEGILAKALMVTDGIFERSRTTRMGEWINVTFSAGNFTASGSMTWTVASGDQITYQYMLIGKTIFINVTLDTTTVGGTPDIGLRIAIPGGFTAAKSVQNTPVLFDAGVQIQGFAFVTAGGSVIECRRVGNANWSAATDTTYVRIMMAFAVN